MEICTTSDSGQTKCGQGSQQIGNLEVLTEEIKKNTKTYIRLSYYNSVLAFHSYKECPHIQLEISLVSKKEAPLIQQGLDSIEDKEDVDRIAELFNTFTNGQNPITLDNPDDGTFTADIDPSKSFQVLASAPFTNEIKMGLFVEVFSSPFTSDVIAVYLQSDTQDQDKQTPLVLNRFKSSKTIWVDLEPGTYTLQVISIRQTEHYTKYTRDDPKTVTFQLYIATDLINVAREAFLPKSLNYLGLLGVGQGSKDFGQVTLFYDDCTLMKALRNIRFAVQSEQASVSV